MKNYFEISGPLFRKQLAAGGQTSISQANDIIDTKETFLSDKATIPRYLKKFMRMFESTNNEDVFKEIFNDIYAELQTPPNRMVLLRNGLYYCGKAYDTIHHNIIVKLVYDGLVYFKNQKEFENYNMKYPYDFICITQDFRWPYNNWFVSESYKPHVIMKIKEDQDLSYIQVFNEVIKDIDKNFEILFDEEPI